VKGSTSLNLSVGGTDGHVEDTRAGSAIFSLTLNYVSGSTFSNMTQLIFRRKADYASCANPTTPGDLWSDDFINAWKAINPEPVRMLGALRRQ